MIYVNNNYLSEDVTNYDNKTKEKIHSLNYLKLKNLIPFIFSKDKILNCLFVC